MPAPTQLYQDLRQVRFYVQSGWTQNRSVDEEGCMCLGAAIVVTAEDADHFEHGEYSMTKRLRDDYRARNLWMSLGFNDALDVIVFNDSQNTTREAVLDLIDTAIATETASMTAR